jgi:hypothetical protein
MTSPRKVKNILMRGGKTARGVGFGSTIDEIKAAYPDARVDHSPEGTFELTLVKVPRGDGGRMQFAVDINTDETTFVGIPLIPFCE